MIDDLEDLLPPEEHSDMEEREYLVLEDGNYKILIPVWEEK